MTSLTLFVRSIITTNSVLTINKRSESVNMCIILLRRKLKYELCTSVSFSQSDLVTAAAATYLLASCRAVPGLLSWSVIGGGSNINSCRNMLRVKPSVIGQEYYLLLTRLVYEGYNRQLLTEDQGYKIANKRFIRISIVQDTIYD